LSAIAQDERERIAKRAGEGRAAAKWQAVRSQTEARWAPASRGAPASRRRRELPSHRPELPVQPHHSQPASRRM